MTLDWLYKITLDISVLIGLILVLRPIVRRLLGARVAYWLWLIPMVRILLPARLPRPETIMEAVIPSVPNMVEAQFLLLKPLLNPLLQASSSEAYLLPANIPLLWILFVGVLLCISIQLALNWNFRRFLNQSSDRYSTKSERLKRLLEASRFSSTKIFAIDSPRAPFATGLLEPRIFLPSDFERRFSEQEQYWVVRHELAHIRRGDIWFQFLAELVRAIFWFNPIIHLALRNFRDDQEYACDHSVLSTCNSTERYQYGKALLMGSSPQLVPSVLTFFSKNKERYLMLGRHKNSNLNAALGISLCFIVGLFTFTSAPQSIAQSEQRPIFDEIYDAETPIKFSGKIVRIDFGEHFSLLHIDAENDDGTTTAWIVEGAHSPKCTIAA